MRASYLVIPFIASRQMVEAPVQRRANCRIPNSANVDRLETMRSIGTVPGLDWLLRAWVGIVAGWPEYQTVSSPWPRERRRAIAKAASVEAAKVAALRAHDR